MDVITELEDHFGVSLPRGYRDWSLKKYTDRRVRMNQYLWVPEAEWIPPDEIPQYDLGRTNIIPGLIPFAFSGAGDHWCWNTQVKNGDAEYEILCCWHDEELADRFAPTFPAWFYRNCLVYASEAIEIDYDSIDEGRHSLRLWSKRLSDIYPGDWAVHLAGLASRTPSEYKHPKLRDSVMMFGFITAMEVDEIVADQFGPSYLEQKVAWGSWPE